IRFPFQIDLKGQTFIFVRRAEKYELFEGIGFRQHENLINVNTAWLKWLSLFGSYVTSVKPNFFPGPGLAPFPGNATDAVFNAIIRQPRLRFEELYIYSRLEAQGPVPGTRAAAGARIFDNHIVRSRVDYQFTREWSLRG